MLLRRGSEFGRTFRDIMMNGIGGNHFNFIQGAPASPWVNGVCERMVQAVERVFREMACEELLAGCPLQVDPLLRRQFDLLPSSDRNFCRWLDSYRSADGREERAPTELLPGGTAEGCIGWAGLCPLVMMRINLNARHNRGNLMPVEVICGRRFHRRARGIEGNARRPGYTEAQYIQDLESVQPGLSGDLQPIASEDAHSLLLEAELPAREEEAAAVDATAAAGQQRQAQVMTRGRRGAGNVYHLGGLVSRCALMC
jgi:hypothetical protein